MAEKTIATALTEIVNANRRDIIHIETPDPLKMQYALIEIIKQRETQIDDLIKGVAELEERLSRVPYSK